MRSLIFPSTGSKATSSVMPAAVIRPAFCRTAALYQREFCPLYARTYSASSTTTDQIHVRVPYVLPSSRNGEMCRSSASAILRSSSFNHVVIMGPLRDRRTEVLVGHEEKLGLPLSGRSAARCVRDNEPPAPQYSTRR